MRRIVRLLLVAVVVGGIIFLFVLPGRTWFAQSNAMSAAERQHQALSQENALLGRKVAQLQDPAYIQQIAREQYGLVMPGENAYAILPPAATTTTTAPPRAKPKHHKSFWQDLIP